MRHVALAAVALVSMGCAASNTCDDTDSRLIGAWRYDAIQESPSHSTISGTFVVSAVACGTLSGQLDIIETPSAGPARRLAGPVTGSVIDATSLRFDATFDAGTREHLAKLIGDSLTGSWLNTDGAQTASGSFGGHRQ